MSDAPQGESRKAARLRRDAETAKSVEGSQEIIVNLPATVLYALATKIRKDFAKPSPMMGATELEVAVAARDLADSLDSLADAKN